MSKPVYRDFSWFLPSRLALGSAPAGPEALTGQFDVVVDVRSTQETDHREIGWDAPAKWAPVVLIQRRWREGVALDLPEFAEVVTNICALVTADKRILVHCSLGRSRSATIAVAVLVAQESLTLTAAFARIRAVRPAVNLPPVYWNLLERWIAVRATVERLQVDENRST